MEWRSETTMMIRKLTCLCLLLLVAACAAPTGSLSMMSYDSIELSEGVAKLVNDAGDNPIALESDARIRCVDMTAPGHDTPSKYCQTRDEFEENMLRNQQYIRSIKASSHP